jgi:hypothetical protein
MVGGVTVARNGTEELNAVLLLGEEIEHAIALVGR